MDSQQKLTRFITTTFACMALIGSFASFAEAQPKWSEKTVLSFDSPVMIPGTTLQPGRYLFQLADNRANRNVMQVFTEDGQKLVTTTITVPAKRMEPNGDVVLKFAETKGSTSAPVALKGFFYPGSLYGHEFVYTDAQAKKIAQDTHKLVLSQDIEGSDFEKATLHLTDDQGRSTAYTPNPDVTTDWTVWIAEWRKTAPTTTNADNRNNMSPTSRSTADSRQTTGTTGRNTSDTTAPATATGTTGAAAIASEHATAIQQLIDKALTNAGATVSIDRQTLEQIRDHAAAIARDSSSQKK